MVARGEYDFTAASQEELSMQAGEMLNLVPKELQPCVRGWLLASVDGETTGSSQPTTLRSLAREETAGPQIWRGSLRPTGRTRRHPKQPWLHKYPNLCLYCIP
ncbi:probable peroxisomal membrane protein PEX13 [Oreochromis aureus]|uniref:probable peroxisomal membrane protein PEX13 n=1 Tax=Oreochromis aureus TaxID=47969 RepID=UPI0019534FAD|nr:probable peroxisomal membrane protein PEX13 [Oreochromis aureus]